MVRPRVEVLREYEDYLAMLLRANPSHRDSIKERDAPERRFRWSVKLDCGCATEALTYGEENPPTEGTDHPLGPPEDPASAGHAYVIDAGSTATDAQSGVRVGHPGYLWCGGHGEDFPEREIVKWVKQHERRWASSGSAYTGWTVLLSCGHYCHHVISDPDWRPERGHERRPELAERWRGILAEKVDDDAERSGRNYIEARLADEFSWPETTQACAPCVTLRRIVSFEPIGPLTWPGDEARPSRDILTRQLKAPEQRADRLRAQLAEAEARAAEIGKERDRLST